LTALRELAAHLPDELVVVDVGCRWGFAQHWDALRPHVRLIGFDADEAEVARLREEFAGRPEMRFYARTLGAKGGRATLIRTHEASGTSLFRPDHSHLTHLPDIEEARISGESTVEVSTLDDVMGGQGLHRIDALKLDTQGSELDILRGSIESLGDARHLEVEVAVNELFEGAPLFGEVDAFLRARGFALWRFRDLVHYALREAPNPQTVTEQLWYQGIPQPIAVRGGQLIWCNAHFVRRDMYEPSIELGWPTRVRDACLMHALGFYDLAVLSLRRLLVEPNCPAAVRSSGEAMIAEVLQPEEPDRVTTGPSHRGALTALLRRGRRHLHRSSDEESR
jgi:FkbM family methyltransferase